MFTSSIIYKNKEYEIDRYFCTKCERVYSLDNKTGKRINLDGLVGEEA